MSTGASTHAHCAEQLKTKLPCQGVILEPFVKLTRHVIICSTSFNLAFALRMSKGIRAGHF